jgi:hypothetical protein
MRDDSQSEAAAKRRGLAKHLDVDSDRCLVCAHRRLDGLGFPTPKVDSLFSPDE